MEKTKYWWKDDPEIGVYHFCYDEAENYSFYISEVAVRYTYGWTEEERQRRFNGAKFTFGGCTGGVSYDRLLKAETIEEAKKEFEEWYQQYLESCIENLKRSLSEYIEEHEQFLLYKKSV